MRVQIVDGRIRPPKTTSQPEEVLPRARALFRADQSKDLRSLIAEKIEDLRHYDVLGMERILSILAWGKTGSLLLSSYLDGHEDVLMLPTLVGRNLYEFFEGCQSLSLRDKLLGYPASSLWAPFFEGEFAISSTQYYAAVQAIVESSDKWPAEFLASRRAFILFAHIAYELALGRRPASSRPLIVFAQHLTDDVTARHLVEDFPQARFIHTVRDPITLCDRFFDRWFNEREHLSSAEPLPDSLETHSLPKNPSSAADPWPVSAYRKLLDLLPSEGFGVLPMVNRDRPHSGMESRSRAIRFADLHCDAAETMRDLAEWLGISWQATLLDSTFNGIPYVVTRNGKAWSGRRPEQVRRSSRDISLKDRGLLYALFHEDFEAWDYPCPKIFGNGIVRSVVFFSLILFPMKMEMTAARAIFKNRVVPALRRGNISFAISSLLRIVSCRLAIVALLVPDFLRRLFGRKTLLRRLTHRDRALWKQSEAEVY